MPRLLCKSDKSAVNGSFESRYRTNCAVSVAGALFARRDPRLLKIPPYLSLLLIVIGVAWLFMLPLNEYSRRTYISENALLPGQVHTYFGGSDQNVFRAYRHEISALENKTNTEYVAFLSGLLSSGSTLLI